MSKHTLINVPEGIESMFPSALMNYNIMKITFLLVLQVRIDTIFQQHIFAGFLHENA